MEIRNTQELMWNVTSVLPHMVGELIRVSVKDLIFPGSWDEIIGTLLELNEWDLVLRAAHMPNFPRHVKALGDRCWVIDRKKIGLVEIQVNADKLSGYEVEQMELMSQLKEALRPIRVIDRTADTITFCGWRNDLNCAYRIHVKGNCVHDLHDTAPGHQVVWNMIQQSLEKQGCKCLKVGDSWMLCELKTDTFFLLELSVV